jgi:hypothetical protein
MLRSGFARPIGFIRAGIFTGWLEFWQPESGFPDG